MPVTEFDRYNISVMRQEVEAALAAIGAKHGLNFNVGRITFEPNEFRCKVTAVTSSSVQGQPAGQTVEFASLQRQGAFAIGAVGVDFANSLFRHPKLGRVKIVGYTPRRHKYPYSVQTVNGKRYKVSLMQAMDLVRNKVA